MKFISIIFLVLLAFSCTNVKESDNERNELMDNLVELQLENQELKEKLERIHERYLINTVMVPTFDKETYNHGEKGKITFHAHKYGNFDFKYNVYEMLENRDRGKVLLKNLDSTKFEYSFDLNEMENNKINLWMVFRLEEAIISIPAKAAIQIKE
ncbi:hypothetical protein [Aureibaculum conchae]|uniref:hypothetical protein n=1 Tax=Aureibaculum sp. 2308TA14-22 TaxID=3108392 RepID=UPI0033949418